MYSKKQYDLVIALGQELKCMYDHAPESEQVTMIHVFAIKNGAKILSNSLKPSDIVHVAGIHDSYKTEVSKGIKLSKYVAVKADVVLPV